MARYTTSRKQEKPICQTLIRDPQLVKQIVRSCITPPSQAAKEELQRKIDSVAVLFNK
jgi:hypothetical protein